jgi:hypothetical protein
LEIAEPALGTARRCDFPAEWLRTNNHTVERTPAVEMTGGGNPAQTAGFPHSHRAGDGGPLSHPRAKPAKIKRFHRFSLRTIYSELFRRNNPKYSDRDVRHSSSEFSCRSFFVPFWVVIKLAEQSRKRTIQFVTKAATSLLNNLAEEGIFIADNLPAERDVEILEGHSEQVGAMQLAERFGTGLTGT